MIKTLIRRIVPILLAIGLLCYVLKDVPLNELANQFMQANPYWILMAFFLIILFHIVRAARWQLSLQALGYHPSLLRTTIAMLAGALASMLVPGAGEITRCGTLQRTDGIPFAQGVGSVVAERLVDLAMLIVVIILTLLLEFKRVSQYIIELLSPLFSPISVGSQSGLLVFTTTASCCIVFLGLYWFMRSGKLIQHPISIRVIAILRDIKRGFLSIQQLEHPSYFILYTVLSYGLVFLTTYILFFDAPQTQRLPATAALTILTVSSLGGLAVPTQGGLGTYHFLASRALVLYGLSLTDGVIVATFLHGIQMGSSLLISSLSFLIIPFIISRKANTVIAANDPQPMRSNHEN